MRILNLYIARKLLFTTLAATGVLTFVMIAGSLYRLFDLLARGVSPASLATLLLLLVPIALKFTLPFSVLCAVILVFSRLSADNEITAMRATGTGLWQIVTPALLLGILLSAFCAWLQLDLAPRCRWKLDMIKDSEGARTPLALIEPGRPVSLPGYVIYTSSRDQNRLYDLRVYVLGKDNRLAQDITARYGDVRVNEDLQIIEFLLHDAQVSAADPSAPRETARQQRAAGKTMFLPVDYGDQLNRKDVTRRAKYQDTAGLIGLIQVYGDLGWDIGPLRLEMHKRLSMALSPFAFILVGIPFGIRTRRSEAAIGMVVSLILATIFYAFLIAADELKTRYQVAGEVLIWLPNILYQVGGLWALYRLAKH